MTYKNHIALAVLVFCCIGSADAKYSLSCSMNGKTAAVYACNSGRSAEGQNRYINVKACERRDCDEDYDLMYVYASPGSCDVIGSITFRDTKDFCLATFRN